jgi:prepilin-type N-terminal cleavage/methylation domain-containing protein
MPIPWRSSDRPSSMNRLNKNVLSVARPQAVRTGFTLIEVLVVLALTLIMMSVFATIFQQAGTFVTRQKGVGENDQSARILTTVLKTDLEARTMRFLAPFHPNMQTLGDDAQNRQGYFYVSENDPTDDTDDVLQFTVMMNAQYLQQLNNPVAGGYLYGRGLSLVPPWQANVTYAAGAVVRPATTGGNTTGYAFKNLGTGTLTSGATEPNWTTVAALAGTITDGTGTWTAIAFPLDQPDGDDQVVVFGNGSPTLDPPAGSPNSTGASQFAEVTYFLRHGTLCRRVLLIRQPYDPTTGFTNAQPNDGTGTALIPNAYPPYPTAPLPSGYSGNFWTDFDYSARINAGNSPGVNFLTNGNGLNSLDNTSSTANLAIGRPDNRFGFDQTYPAATLPPVTTATTFYGAPREYALQFNASANSVTGTAPTQLFFFGRYTQEETSNTNFQFPGNMATVAGNPFSPMGAASLLAIDSSNYTMWMLDGNPPTTPVSLAGGSRRGEDILLTNVVSFDVKLWDPHYSEVPTGGGQGIDVNRNGVIDVGPGAFADVGHAAPFGDFQQAKNAFPVFGPVIDSGYTLPATANTWAPVFTRTFNGVTYNYNNVFDTWYRFFNFDNIQRTYDNADQNLLYAPAPYRPRVGNTWQPGTAYTVGALVDPVNTANGYVYQCAQAGTSGTAPAGQVDPFSLNNQVTALSVPPALPTVSANSIADGTVQWNAVPPANVQAIQITVKYLDPTLNLLRQVTIVQSLTDGTSQEPAP